MKRRNLKLRKAILMTCCAMALVALSVGATLAYLTDVDTVNNTFTVGQVGLTLDEAEVDDTGKAIVGENAKRVQQNTYKLLPGMTYEKDPTVHVNEDSEDSWIFVKVENGIKDIEAIGDTSIANQIKNNGWSPLGDRDDVYYKKYMKGQEKKDLKVFERFTLKGEELVNGTAGVGEISIDEYNEKAVNVTAYAIQMAGFEDNPVGAWDAGDWE